jgi:hypothetical protein
MRRSFLLDRRGLRDGHDVPVRLRVFDTVGVLVDVGWVPVSFVISLWVAGTAHRAGLHWIAAGAIVPIGSVVLVNWCSRFPEWVYRHLAVFIGLADRTEAACFPLMRDSPYPDAWQKPV